MILDDATHGSARIAWLGPAPDDVGGVPAMAREMLLGLVDSDLDLEIFLDSPRIEFLDVLASRPNVRLASFSASWPCGRWYSRSAAGALVTGTAARVHVGTRIAERVAERHSVRPFDFLYRLSQIELLALRRLRRRLPPIIVHPEVHAQGELRHRWRERALALRGEPRSRFALGQAHLAFRAQVQRRDLRDVAMLVAPSRRFADLLAADYGYPRERIRVLPNVIDLDRFAPAQAPPPPAPVKLLFVSRMSVSKGVDQIVALSHRLRDLAGQVRIQCLGGASLCSDYRVLLDDLEPSIATYVGQIAATDLPALYRSAHGLLQPSLSEPFALTVGEALASGLPVIASDEVGAAEGVDPRVCRTHPAGDVDALEREVRRLVDDIRRGWDPSLPGVARAHAEAHLGRERFAQDLVALVDELRGRVAGAVPHAGATP